MLGLEQDRDLRQDRPLVTRHYVSELDRSGIRILLVEDYPTNQMIASAHLRKEGYRVELAQNGQEAVAAFRKKSFDLILMDIQMPVMGRFSGRRRDSPDRAEDRSPER